MKNALNNQVGMLGDMFLWHVANLKQWVIYFIKQACGNDILASVYCPKHCFRLIEGQQSAGVGVKISWGKQ